jgi:hypothetical protein
VQPAAPPPPPAPTKFQNPLYYPISPQQPSPAPIRHYQPFLPVQPAGADEVQEQTLWDEPTPWPEVVHRRRQKLIRFFIIEGIALGILILAANVALASRASDDWVGMIAKILTILMAIGIAVVPIVFYGLPDTLPRQGR